VSYYFKKLEDCLDTLGSKDKPERIFNMDEKGCRLTIHHQQQVLAEKGAKRLHLIAPEHAQNVTVVGCVNAIGNSIPAMIIFKGKRLKAEFQDNLPAGTLVKMAPKGYMTTEIFVDFVHHLGRYKTEGPALLIFDGAKSHLDYSIVEAADSNGITLLCLPSNTTHELQPLDKSVYRSYESHWDKEVLRYWDVHPDRTITKPRFNIIFSKVWPKCTTPDNILGGFRATGIFPFNADAIPEEAFAPSVLSERRLKNQTNEENFDKEDDIPLAHLINNNKDHVDEDTAEPNISTSSFSDLLPTPEAKEKTKKTVRRKALNYKAQKVTKDLFVTSNPTTSGTTHKNKIKPNNNKTWYCRLCNLDKVADMRRCLECNTWAHERCIGFTESDDEGYICSNCDN
jgi:hypothetical protein